MTPAKALDILTRYNAWRRGADCDMPDVRDIGEALDFAIGVLKERERAS